MMRELKVIVTMFTNESLKNITANIIMTEPYTKSKLLKI